MALFWYVTRLGKKFRLNDEKVKRSYTNIIIYLIDNNDLWYRSEENIKYQIVDINKKKIDLIKKEIKKKLDFNSIDNKKEQEKELKKLQSFTKELEKHFTNNWLKDISITDFIGSGAIIALILNILYQFIERFNQLSEITSYKMYSILTIIGSIIVILFLFYFVLLAAGISIEFKKYKYKTVSKKLKYKTVLIAIDELKEQIKKKKVITTKKMLINEMKLKTEFVLIVIK